MLVTYKFFGCFSTLSLFFLLLPSIFSSIKVFSNESTLCLRWPKYWSFSFNISPSNEHPGLMSFRMDRLDLLAVQGTLKSLLQYHSSKASIHQSSAFFIVQLSHPYMTTGVVKRTIKASPGSSVVISFTTSKILSLIPSLSYWKKEKNRNMVCVCDLNQNICFQVLENRLQSWFSLLEYLNYSLKKLPNRNKVYLMYCLFSCSTH